jgi:glutamate 5-kinase
MSSKDILVVKVGTSTLLGSEEEPSKAFEHIAASIGALAQSHNIVLVTSGAIGFGVTQLGLAERPTGTPELQALSMIGQVGLLRKWREAFGGVTIGQVLVTKRDLDDTVSRQHFIDSINHIWGYGAIPVVNENDAVATEEISFGDNDQLAAQIAVRLGADCLVILSDHDGIQKDFGTNQQARLEEVSIHEVKDHIRPTKSALGKGGASSKILAAHIALSGGVEVYVAHAASEQAIESAIASQSGTKIVQ